MITYTVYYRKVGSWLWKKLKSVEGDAINETKDRIAFFISDGTKVEIPLAEMEIKFSSERFKQIHARMELEAGQKVAVK